MKRIVVLLGIVFIVAFILFGLSDGDVSAAVKNAWEFIKIVLSPAIALFNILKSLF